MPGTQEIPRLWELGNGARSPRLRCTETACIRPRTGRELKLEVTPPGHHKWLAVGSQAATLNSVARSAMGGLVTVTTRGSLKASWPPALGWADLVLAHNASVSEDNLRRSCLVGPQERT